MGKLIYGIIVAVILGFILYPSVSNVNPSPQLNAEQPPQAAPQQQESVQPSEVKAKEALIDDDVRITEELSREHSVYTTEQLLANLQKDQALTQASFQKQVSSWLDKHQSVVYIQYGSISKDHNSNSNAKFHNDNAPQKVIEAAAEYLEEADRSVSNQQSYISSPFQVDNVNYFVLGEPSADAKHYILGVVKQDLLDRVRSHQRKNMRLESFQSEKRINVKTVEPGQLKNKSYEAPNTDNDNGNEESHYAKNEVVVKFRRAPSAKDLRQILGQINGSIIKKLGQTYIFKSNRMDTPKLIHYFRKWNVEYVEPHYLYMTNEEPAAPTSFGRFLFNNMQGPELAQTFKPNDELYSKYQWNLRQIGTDQSWTFNKDASGVIVAVIDTGVDLTHPDIEPHIASGYNVIKPEDQPDDDVGHGTHVSGVISALVNNRLGVAGMTWSSRILPVKVLDETGAGSTYAVAQGIIWATDHGAKVINMSLGNYATSSFLHDAIKYAYDKDVVLIAASGNDNTDRPSYPAYYPEVFAVAASDSNNNRASFSNYGDYIDVTAPGVNIASTYPKNQYVALSGTSMATPHVSALAALIRATNPSLRNTEVMDIIRTTAQDIGDPGTDSYFGYGLINVPKAVEEAQKRK
ncbi:peptidase S8 [Paenibacillus albiflavus]|uniref:Peptidase S8 n=1 Tax=Paenibacillus albiflavus TaxID=2545760 RepID=A0A4R4E8S6_9BACL|nr:S8 family peptidase [Paenibacillus albiflavus]TCZ75567.1 peptidase S8 [Paenibacillus albiflavus]